MEGKCIVVAGGIRASLSGLRCCSEELPFCLHLSRSLGWFCYSEANSSACSSHSTPFSPASALLSANLFLQQVFASRPIPRIRRSLRALAMNGKHFLSIVSEYPIIVKREMGFGSRTNEKARKSGGQYTKG